MNTRVAMLTLLDRIALEAEELNRLDGVAGDGDLGVTMGIAGRAIWEELESNEPADMPALLTLLGKTTARKAPSTGGTLLAGALMRAARTAKQPSVSYSLLLGSGIDAIMELGNARVGEKTMLDALAPALEAARKAENAGAGPAAVARAAGEAARAGAEATSTLPARHGRAGWLAERAQGSPDAGAWLVSVILLALAEIVSDPAGGLGLTEEKAR
jgi:dihydroxyacetone kinase